MKKTKTTFRNGLFARFLKRLLGEQRGAVAMEYIMITLLVAAAIFALVMVFGSQLKNMLNTIIEIMTGKNPQEVEKVVEDYNTDRDKIEHDRKAAENAADTIQGGGQGRD